MLLLEAAVAIPSNIPNMSYVDRFSVSDSSELTAGPRGAEGAGCRVEWKRSLAAD